MATEMWTLHWEVGQKDDGTWMLFRVDPQTSKILQECGAVWITIGKSDLRVDMEIRDMPPIPPPSTDARGATTSHPPFRLESIRYMVTEMILYDLLHPELRGKTFDTLTFYDKSDGSIFKQSKNRTF